MQFGPWDIDTIRALYQSGDVIDTFDPVSDSELPPPTTSGTIVVSVGGVYTTGTIAGTANEVSVTQVGADLTFAFDAGFFLKGYNTASTIRTRIGLGTVATTNIVAASADSSGNTATAVGAAYVQAEVQAILDELRTLKTELRTLKTNMRSSGVLAT
jgi:hypothetical protein